MRKSVCVPAVIVTGMIMTGCNMPSYSPASVPASTPTAIATILSNPSSQTSAALPGSFITDMSWNEDMNTISISIDSWPGGWPWKMYLDGVEIPVEGGSGNAAIRPNAPLEQPPDGLFIGSNPWVSGLEEINFPCCGTIQFEVPGKGLSNIYEYNFGGLCQTRSTKVCAPAWTVHQGDLVISGSETFLIEDIKYQQEGNIYVRDTGTLTIKNAELKMGRGATPTIHVYIFVDPGATLNIENSRIYASPNGGLACVMNSGTMNMIDSPTAIHYLDMSGSARLTMVNSELINNIGGILQIGGGSTDVSDSTLGALGLTVPAGGHLEADGLKSGTYFSSFDVHDLIPEANYHLLLKNTTLLEDFPPGPWKNGPYERGWIFFLDPNSHVRLSNSELRKVFLELRNDTASFRDLKVDLPANLEYRDISLTNITVSGEWPFTIVDSNLTISNSNYLFLQPSGSSTVTLRDSHMVEFIPRNFTGMMIFENATWTTAGEILGEVPYHSNSNSFTIKGSLSITDELRTNLQWKNAFVTREFELIVTDPDGKPWGGVLIKIDGQEVITDETGTTKFSLKFDETNYNQPVKLETWQSGNLIASQDIDFFTATPIMIGK